MIFKRFTIETVPGLTRDEIEAMEDFNSTKQWRVIQRIMSIYCGDALKKLGKASNLNKDELKSRADQYNGTKSFMAHMMIAIDGMAKPKARERTK